MPAGSRIIPYESMRSILITDSAHNISKLKVLQQRLDTPEAAKHSQDELADRVRKSDVPCPSPFGTNTSMPQPGILIALFSLIALVMGFLARGYVIRKIEGGL